MPTLARFGAVNVIMRYRDHPPPHVHLVGGGVNVSVRIADRAVMAGAAGKVMEPALDWIRAHEQELLSAWEDAQAARPIQLATD